jgi:hypothetical protein
MSIFDLKPEKRASKRSDILERRRVSFSWFNENYYGEFAEVYRAAKCKTEPIMIEQNGKKVEDTSRTNVAMPDLATMIRRNTARMTANPPNIRFRVSGDNSDDPQDDQKEMLADRLNAWSYYQFDRSGEAKEHRRHVQQEETFGWSVTKLFEDKIESVRSYRYDRSKITSRAKLMELEGNDPETIERAVEAFGDEMPPEEISRSIMQEGDEIKSKVPVTKYEGPVLKTIFIGDLFPEPGFVSLDKSGWIVEDYLETDVWLEDMLDRKYEDPDTGQMVQVFDPKACDELIESGVRDGALTLEGRSRLRDQLRTAVGQSDPHTLQYSTTKLVPGKRFLISECHETVDGYPWIYWVGNESVLLGCQPYPWDLYGKWQYTEFCGLPDFVNGIGDSTPRLGRFLHKLHNVGFGQRTDLIRNILRRLVMVRRGADIKDEATERSLLRMVEVKDFSDIKEFEEVDVPASAWTSEEQLLRMLNMLEPSLGTVDPGSGGQPMAGKTATTSVLAQRAVDLLTQSKLDELDLYLKEVNQKKLWMLQQTMQKAVEIPGSYSRTEALSQRYGKTSKISIDPYEIQEDIEVEPEAGSTLSQDDELRRLAAQQMAELAARDPLTWNAREVNKFYASTIRGAGDVNRFLNPPPTAPPPPPPPKVTVSFTQKVEDLPPATQQAILGAALGLPPDPDIETQSKLKGVQQIADAADAADRLDMPAESDHPSSDPEAAPEQKTPPTKAGRV